MSARGTKKWAAERAAWHARTPWPCLVLAVDPGIEAGASLVYPYRDNVGVLWAREVKTYSRDVERCVNDAVCTAIRLSLRLMLSVEEWGRGGPLGIDTWIGLGEMRGAWKREYILAAPTSNGHIVPSTGVVRANMTTWRSYMIDETGDVDGDGKHQTFDSDGWKRAATRRCAELFPDLKIEGANAAESALQGAYAMRCDDVGARLSMRTLRAAGLERPAKKRRQKREPVAVRPREIEFL